MPWRACAENVPRNEGLSPANSRLLSGPARLTKSPLVRKTSRSDPQECTWPMLAVTPHDPKNAGHKETMNVDVLCADYFPTIVPAELTESANALSQRPHILQAWDQPTKSFPPEVARRIAAAPRLPARLCLQDTA